MRQWLIKLIHPVLILGHHIQTFCPGRFVSTRYYLASLADTLSLLFSVFGRRARSASLWLGWWSLGTKKHVVMFRKWLMMPGFKGDATLVSWEKVVSVTLKLTLNSTPLGTFLLWKVCCSKYIKSLCSSACHQRVYFVHLDKMWL